MKTRTMTQFVSAAAGVLLPVAVWAQDLSNDVSSGSLDTSAVTSGNTQSSSGASTGSSGSYGSGGTFSGSSSQQSNNQSGSFSSGIMVQDGTAYVIHRLQNEMSLSDGSKIEPNGTVHKSDGSTQSIGTGQILTMDGRVMSAPFKSGSAQSSTSNSSLGLGDSTSPSTPDLNSGPLNNGSTNQSPADKSDGSGLAPGATSTDPAEDYTD
ncbi:DUF6799 domain-containing protein [Verrucomicrobiota bacterium sgz303538]